MIKCEVVFDGDNMVANGWIVYPIGDEWEVVKRDRSEQFTWLEDAITYCMEQSNV